MTLIVRPHTYTAGNKIKATENTANETTLYTCVNGNIGEANVTYVTANDGLRVCRAGPNAGGTNGTRVAVVTDSFTLTGGSASGTRTIVYSTNAAEGNPAFSAVPTPLGVALQFAGPAPDPDIPLIWISAISATQLTIQWDRTFQASTNATAVVVTIGLIGDV